AEPQNAAVFQPLTAVDEHSSAIRNRIDCWLAALASGHARSRPFRQEPCMQKKVAVILSGCGVYDGSEIHAAVITPLRLDQRGAHAQCFAPNIPQFHVVDHLTGEVSGETRNVLTESARIARGEVKDVRQLHAAEFDALIIPGGFGAAKNLSDFAVAGAACCV